MIKTALHHARNVLKVGQEDYGRTYSNKGIVGDLGSLFFYSKYKKPPKKLKPKSEFV